MSLLDNTMFKTISVLNKKIVKTILISSIVVLMLTIVIIILLYFIVVYLFKSMDIEISNRIMAEKSLEKLNLELEERVDKRTHELSEANTLLEKNMSVIKQAEKAVQENEAFLNAIIENIPDMIFVKNAGSLRFVRLNQAGEELLGFSRDDLLGKNDYDFFPSQQADFFIQKDRKAIEDGVLLDIPGEPIQTRFLGTRILHTKKMPINDKDGTPQYLLGISADITGRKEAENRIKASLKEKEALLKEIHHRVKNNMQVVSSLLSLQSGTINDQKTLDVFMETEARVQSMAFVHEILYQSDNLSQIKLHEYLDAMTNHLLHIYTSSIRPVDIEINTRGINLQIEHAVPCGLIVTELFTNSLKYANTTDSRLQIRITADYEADTHLTMKITDNGPGLPADFDLANIKTLGLKIVTELITEQLEGTYRVENDSGVCWVIHWPVV